MLLSKEIRDLILKTSKIMNKFIIVFKSDINQDEISHFLTNYGNFIKIIQFKDENEINSEVLVFILSQVPNLEELLCEDSSENQTTQPEFINKIYFELPKMRILTILNENLKNVLKNVKNLKNLEKLTIYRYEDNDDEFLTNFIVQQDNLKELSLINYQKSLFKPFPSRDISNEAKFNLTKFEYHFVNCEVFDNFLSFFKIQSKNLTELKLDGNLNDQIFDIIFEKCKNLEKLGLFADDDSVLISNINSHRVLESVKYYETCYVYMDEFSFNAFPNTISLKCSELFGVYGIFNNLINLEAEIYSCASSEHLKFRNLENFITGFIDNESLKEFLQSAPNVKNLTLSRYFIKDFRGSEFLDVFKRLKNTRNVETFKVKLHSKSESPADEIIMVNNVQRTILFTKKSFDFKYNTFLETLKEIFLNYTFSSIS